MRRLMSAIIIIGTALAAGSPAASAETQKTTPAAQAAGQKPARVRAARAVKARATASTPVHLNLATVAQFQTLPGVGAGTAQRILDYRQKNGPFKKVEELMNVKGIGEKSFLKLKPLVTLGPDRVDRAGAQR